MLWMAIGAIAISRAVVCVHPRGPPNSSRTLWVKPRAIDSPTSPRYASTIDTHSVCGCISNSTDRVADRHVRETDDELDLHVMDRDRVGVVGDVQVRRLLVADRAAEQQPVAVFVGRHAVGAHPVLALVQHLHAVGIGRQDRPVVEHRRRAESGVDIGSR